MSQHTLEEYDAVFESCLHMFIAHLPAGYLLSRVFKSSAERRILMLGSVLPDIDMIYFYTLGQRQSHHHDYVTHLPLVFVVLLLFALAFKALRTKGFALFCGLMLHVFLDTLCGDIKWLWPLSDQYFSWVVVDDVYGHWIKNFVFHWTFAVEVAISLAAVAYFANQRMHKSEEPNREFGICLPPSSE